MIKQTEILVIGGGPAGLSAACAAADRTLKLSPQGYTALERLICTV